MSVRYTNGTVFHLLSFALLLAACEQPVPECPACPEPSCPDVVQADGQPDAELLALALDAATGDRLSQFNLGVEYFSGQKVEASPARAAWLWQQAAQAGDPIAMSNYGYLLASGTGVDQDHTAAVAWFQRSAEAGNDEACVHLARALANGDGAVADPVAAAAWAIVGARRAKKSEGELAVKILGTAMQLRDAILIELTTEQKQDAEARAKQITDPVMER